MHSTLDRFLALFGLAVLVESLMLIPRVGHSIALVTIFAIGRCIGSGPVSIMRLRMYLKSHRDLKFATVAVLMLTGIVTVLCLVTPGGWVMR